MAIEPEISWLRARVIQVRALLRQVTLGVGAHGSAVSLPAPRPTPSFLTIETASPTPIWIYSSKDTAFISS